MFIVGQGQGDQSVLTKRKATEDNESVYEDDDDNGSDLELKEEEKSNEPPVFPQNQLNELDATVASIQAGDSNGVPISNTDSNLQPLSMFLTQNGVPDITKILSTINAVVPPGTLTIPSANANEPRTPRKRGPKAKYTPAEAKDKRKTLQKDRETIRRARIAKSMQQLGALCGAANSDKSSILLRAIEGLKYQAKRIKIYEDALQIPAHISNAALPSLLSVMQITPFSGSPVQLMAIHHGNAAATAPPPNPPVPPLNSFPVTPAPTNHSQGLSAFSGVPNVSPSAPRSNFNPSGDNMFSNYATAECYLKVR